MTNSIHTREVLTEAEADTLRLAQAILRDAERRVGDEVIRGDLDTVTTLHFGRFLEAASVARDVVFNVLSTASSFCDCANAGAAIRRDLS